METERWRGSQGVTGMCNLAAVSRAALPGSAFDLCGKLMGKDCREQEHFWINLGDTGQVLPDRGEGALVARLP